MNKGLVSIIIPYYRKRNFFTKSLNSAYKQSYKKREIIIIYDDEDKRDLKFIKKIIKKKKNIKILENRSNIGVAKSRNLGLKKSKGEYIAFLDSDDIWKKDKLKIQLKFMKKIKANFSFSSYKIINEQDAIIGHRKAQEVLTYENLIYSCDLGLSTVVLKKSILKKKMMFPDLKTKEDYVLWLLLAKNKIKLYGLNKSLVYWRETKNSLSSNTIQKLIDGFRVYNKYLKFNFIKSIIHLTILSVNFIIKKNK